MLLPAYYLDRLQCEWPIVGDLHQVPRVGVRAGPGPQRLLHGAGHPEQLAGLVGVQGEGAHARTVHVVVEGDTHSVHA